MNPPDPLAPLPRSGRRGLWRCGVRRGHAGAVVLAAGPAVAACGAPDTQYGPINPRQELQAARQAVQVQDGAKATQALDLAERDWLGRNNSVGNPELSQEPEVLREIGNARGAVRLQRWDDAIRYIDAALSHQSADIPE